MTLRSYIARQGDILSILQFSGLQAADEQELVGQVVGRLGRVEPVPEPTPYEGETCSEAPEDDSAQALQLRQALLTLDDVPVQALEDVPSRCGPDVSQIFCESSADDDLAPRATAFRSFSFRSNLSHTVLLLAGDDAADYIIDTRERMRASGGERECEATFEGTTYTWRYTALTPPDTTSQAVAWSMETIGAPIDPIGSEVSAFVVALQKDNILVFLFWSGAPTLGGASESYRQSQFDEMRPSIALADDRLQSLPPVD